MRPFGETKLGGAPTMPASRCSTALPMSVSGAIYEEPLEAGGGNLGDDAEAAGCRARQTVRGPPARIAP